MTKQGDQDASPAPVTLTREVDVLYGSNCEEGVKVYPGQTVKELLADTDLKERVGYGNIKDGNVRYAIDGNVVDENTKIDQFKPVEGQKLQIEILRQVGEKA